MNTVVVHNLSKSYNLYRRPVDRLRELFSIRRRSYHEEYWALRDISFEVERGKIIGLVGQNGAGKSTLLQLLAGVLQPTTGTIQLQGRIAALLALGAGFDPEFTGRDNVYLNGAILGIDRAEMEERFDLIVDFAEIGTFLDQPVKTYSSGMYIRLAFAIAANIDADIFILDEALQVGDSMFQRRCFRRLEQAKRDGKTIVLASHSAQVIQTVCDEAILLDHGTMLTAGPPVNVFHSYRELLSRREEEYVERLKLTQGSRAYWLDDGERGLEDVGFQPALEGEEYRFGSRAAEILEVELYDHKNMPCRAVQRGSWVTIAMTISFHRDITTPSVGMAIHTPVGVAVYGISTDNADFPLDPQVAGTVLTIDFSILTQFHAGNYILSCGVTEKLGTHVRMLDKRKDLLVFQVHSAKRFVGLAYMETNISVRVKEKVESREEVNR
ncbi:MAG: hypothetical protein CMH81_04820 [Nitrospiraceae bacterium]|nr:hypothetical protein [Nitrospiraceae bacterium]|tara:strand:+ start:1574 stop:2893 length:1320 start_codon:yes stop_codon:yes gene_type:complete